MKCTTPLALLLALVPVPALAGTEVRTATTRLLGEDQGRVRDGTALFDGRRMRIDTHDGRRAIVYRGDKSLVWIIDHKRQNYVEFEKPSAEALARQAKARLDALPPEQRAAAEAVALPKLDIVDTGKTDKVQGVPCRELQLGQNGQRLADVCKASFADAGISPGSFEALRELQEVLGQAVTALVSKDVRQEGLIALDSFAKLDGVPMRVRAYKGDQVETETLVTSLASKKFAGTEFDLPQGYQPKISITIR